MHHQNKIKRKKGKERQPLAWMYSSYSKKFIQLSLKPKIPCLQKRNS